MQKWWAYFFGVILAGAFGLVAVAPALGWWLPENVCVFGKDVDLLFYGILAVTGFFFVLTEGILVYALYRFAGQPGRKAQYSHGNHKLELVWTLIPALILLFIAFAQVRAWERIKYQSRMPIPDQVVQVTARQFEWRLRYPTMPTLKSMVGAADRASTGERASVENWKESNVAESWAKDPHIDDLHMVNEVHTWKGAHVRVYLKTRDVIHSFFLPNMRIKQDALPGKTIPLVPTRGGQYALE